MPASKHGEICKPTAGGGYVCWDANTPVRPELGRAFDAIVAESVRELRAIVYADISPTNEGPKSAHPRLRLG